MLNRRIVLAVSAMTVALASGVVAGALASKVGSADRRAIVDAGRSDGSYQGTSDVAQAVKSAESKGYAKGAAKGKMDWPNTTITEMTTTTVTVGAVKTLPANCAPVVRGDGEVFCSYNNPMGTGIH